MAMGLPIVATRFMGLKEIVADDCGWLVEPGDVAALAGRMLVASRLTAEERRRMGQAARSRVSRLFSTGVQIKALSGAVEAA